MEEVPYCIDCKHHEKVKSHRCNHPSLLELNVVDGTTFGTDGCSWMRTSGECGQEGKLFEQRELTFWDRLFK